MLTSETHNKMNDHWETKFGSHAGTVYHPYTPGYPQGPQRYWIGGHSPRHNVDARGSPVGLNVPKLSLQDLSPRPVSSNRYVTSVAVNNTPARTSPTRDISRIQIQTRNGSPTRGRPNGQVPYDNSPNTASTSRLEDSRSTEHSKGMDKKKHGTGEKRIREGTSPKRGSPEGRRKVTINKPIVIQCPRHFGTDTGIMENLFSLGLFFLGAILLGGLGLQLLYKFSFEVDINPRAWSSISKEEAKLFVQVCVILLYGVTVLDLLCVLVCAMQFACIVRILLETSQGYVRAWRFLTNCAFTRNVVITGFFFSVLLIIVVLVLFAFIHFKIETASISTAFLAGGVGFFIITAAHNTYTWRKQVNMPADLLRSREEQGLDNQGYVKDNGDTLSASGHRSVLTADDIRALSTLV